MNRGRPEFPPLPRTAPDHEMDESEAHLAVCATCAAKARALAAAVSEADEKWVTPPALLRERVLASIAEAPRLEPHAEASARLLDVPVARAREFLGWIDDPSRWQPTPFGGLEALWVEGGAATAGAFCGFIRVPAGTSLPLHDHLGPEKGLIVQGRARDQDGRVHRAGDRVDMEAGSRHELEALPIVDCVFLVVLHGGVRFGEMEFRTDTMG